MGGLVAFVLPSILRVRRPTVVFSTTEVHSSNAAGNVVLPAFPSQRWLSRVFYRNVSLTATVVAQPRREQVQFVRPIRLHARNSGHTRNRQVLGILGPGLLEWGVRRPLPRVKY